MFLHYILVNNTHYITTGIIGTTFSLMVKDNDIINVTFSKL